MVLIKGTNDAKAVLTVCSTDAEEGGKSTFAGIEVQILGGCEIDLKVTTNAVSLEIAIVEVIVNAEIGTKGSSA